MMVKKTLGPHKIHVEWVGIPYHDKEEEEERQAHNEMMDKQTLGQHKILVEWTDILSHTMRRRRRRRTSPQ